MERIIIIGNGVSGVTAARHIRKLSDHQITIISSESKYFYSRTALMYIYMGHMKYEHTKPYEDWFWKKNKIDLIYDHVTEIDFRYREVMTEKGEKIPYDRLVLAVGSKPNFFGWPGQKLHGVSGMVSLQDLEYIEKYSADTQQAAIVGGGLIGIELAEMFLSRNIAVTFLVRERDFWDSILPAEEARMISRHIRAHHVDLHLATELKEIKGDDNGRVRSIITSAGDEINCQFVGITAGVSPNIGWLKNTPIKTNKGILVDKYCETSIENVYAIGDCAEFVEPPNKGRNTIEPVWYTGRMMGECVAHTICKEKTIYKPGVWFNSAKFFDIEYQVYGQINPKKADHEIHLYWEHKDGKHSIRMVAEKGSNKLLGINLIGVRGRHVVADKWISKGISLKQAVTDFGKFSFDAEFTGNYTHALAERYNELFPEDKIQKKKKRFSLSGIYKRKQI